MKKQNGRRWGGFVSGAFVAAALIGCGQAVVDSPTTDEAAFADPTLSGTDATVAGNSADPDFVAESQDDALAAANADPGTDP